MSSQDLSLDSVQSSQDASIPQNWEELAENSPQTPSRRANGQIMPGQVLNPGGRPKSKHITEAYKAILEDEGADKYARVVAQIALDSTSKPSDKLAAVQEITDRVEGKATQRMDVRGLICMMPAEGVMSTLDDWAGDDE